MKRSLILILSAGLMLLAACSSQQNKITGAVSISQTTSLPPEANVVIELIDTTNADAAAEVVTTMSFPSGGRQSPLSFEMGYEPDKILADHSYALQSRIEMDERVRWQSDQPTPVLTQGAPLDNIGLTVFPVATSTEGPAVTGTLTYVERVALAPQSEVLVQLADVSKADAPAEILGEFKLTIRFEQVPIPFSIAYDIKDIRPENTYVIQARITDQNGKLIFITTDSYPVITNNVTSLGVILQAVGP